MKKVLPYGFVFEYPEVDFDGIGISFVPIDRSICR